MKTSLIRWIHFSWPTLVALLLMFNSYATYAFDQPTFDGARRYASATRHGLGYSDSQALEFATRIANRSDAANYFRVFRNAHHYARSSFHLYLPERQPEAIEFAIYMAEKSNTASDVNSSSTSTGSNTAPYNDALETFIGAFDFAKIKLRRNQVASKAFAYEYLDQLGPQIPFNNFRYGFDAARSIGDNEEHAIEFGFFVAAHSECQLYVDNFKSKVKKLQYLNRKVNLTEVHFTAQAVVEIAWTIGKNNLTEDLANEILGSFHPSDYSTHFIREFDLQRRSGQSTADAIEIARAIALTEVNCFANAETTSDEVRSLARSARLGWDDVTGFILHFHGFKVKIKERPSNADRELGVEKLIPNDEIDFIVRKQAVKAKYDFFTLAICEELGVSAHLPQSELQSRIQEKFNQLEDLARLNRVQMRASLSVLYSRWKNSLDLCELYAQETRQSGNDEPLGAYGFYFYEGQSYPIGKFPWNKR